MEVLFNAGKARSIGVSNWTIPRLQMLLQYATIKPAINQIEIHPFLPNTELIAFCTSHSIVPVAYSPLGSQHQCPTTGEKLLENTELNRIADQKGASLAQVLIAWGLQRGYAVLPKSSTRERIKENFQVIGLTDGEFEAVNRVAKGRHTRFVNLKDVFGYDVWENEQK